ncbi:MAG: DUF1801 domain-containing protein [Spirochaetia bacterium]|nr:DUF1801 domain-containing protein [Spirochaetia bacterium]
MEGLFRLQPTMRRDPAIDAWFKQRGELGAIARQWFSLMRGCGPDVRETINDGHPIACVGDAAFAYVNTFTAHVNVGFFLGAELEDPTSLLEGTGKRMRHVKLRQNTEINEQALTRLIETAYKDIKMRV